MKRILTIALLAVVYSSGACFADITSKDFVEGAVNQLQASIDLKSDDDAVVHLVGDESVAGNKIFTGTVKLDGNIDAASNDNSVATTKWTNDRVTSAKGDIPVGAKDSTTFTKIWIEE